MQQQPIFGLGDFSQSAVDGHAILSELIAIHRALDEILELIKSGKWIVTIPSEK